MLIFDRETGELASREPVLLCSFGIVEGIGLAIAGISGAFASAGAGIAAGIGADAAIGTAIGTGLEGAAVGAIGGGALNAIEGKPVLQGVLQGGLVGGAVGGFGPALGSGLGIGATGGDVLAGAAAGAFGSGVTGGNVLTGAVGGGASGLLSGALSGVSGPAGTETTPGVSGGPGPSASAVAAPSGLGQSPGLTTGLDVTGAPGSAGPAPFSSAFTDSSPITGAATGTTPGAPGLGSELAPTDAANFASFQGNVPTGANDIGVSGIGAPSSPAAAATMGAPTNAPFDSLTPATAGTAGGPIDSGSFDPSFGGASGGGAAGAAVAGGGGSSGHGLSSLFGTNNSIGKAIAGTGSWGDAISANSNLLLPAAMLGYEGLTANKGLSGMPGYAGLTKTADQLSQQGTELQSYLQTGQLPPGVHQSLQQAGNAAKAAIRGQYASRGMSGSSAEAQDLANVETTIATQGANIATNLLTTGVNESNLSASLYSQILNASLTQDNQLGAALGTLAASAARPTVNITGTTHG